MKLRQKRVLASIIALMAGLPVGTHTAVSVMSEPAIYQRFIWTTGVVGAFYVIVGIVIVLVSE
jgi:hypothetical protein